MKVNKIACLKCGAVLRPWYLKDGVCNGCRNPELIVTAVVDNKEVHAKQGKVLWWDKRDGDGIVTDEAGNEHYIDTSVLIDLTYLDSGDLVTFKDRVLGNCLCGYDVELIEDTAEEECEHSDDFESGHCIDCGEYVSYSERR